MKGKQRKGLLLNKTDQALQLIPLRINYHVKNRSYKTVQRTLSLHETTLFLKPGYLGGPSVVNDTTRHAPHSPTTYQRCIAPGPCRHRPGLQALGTPRKLTMAMENQPFEDVSPRKEADFQVPC